MTSDNARWPAMVAVKTIEVVGPVLGATVTRFLLVAEAPMRVEIIVSGGALRIVQHA